MTTVAQLIRNLHRQYEPNDHVAVAIWEVEDVMDRAEDRDVPVSRDQAEVIIQRMDDCHDACIGFNWCVVDCYLDELPLPDDHAWSWTEAFDKFGFNDGDGRVMTDAVIEALEKIGCTVTAQRLGLHNRVITSIKTADGDEAMSLDNPNVRIGYDCPRNYLPSVLVRYLDETLPAIEEDNA